MPETDPKTTTPASDALGDLRALTATPHPDARLLVACDRFAVLRDESLRLYRKHERGYMNRIREMRPEQDALEVEIAKTPARTAAGRRAKADVAFYMLGITGTIAQIAKSTLDDFVNADAARGDRA